MKLIAGLGNPGREYAATRHNIGFMVIDRLAHKLGGAVEKKKFKALFGLGQIGSEKVLLVKPQTYMNLSGKAVGLLVQFFKVDAADLVVVHDDLDLPFETLRVKEGGGDGGHKGLQSVIESLGTDAFLRLRLGIGKPVTKNRVESYVLEPFGKEERDRLPALLEKACGAVEEILSSGPRSAMNKFNIRGGDPNLPEPSS